MWADADAVRVAATIVDVARHLARSVPAPRGAPYFYLDSEASYDLRALDAFSARGIFRKYEFALDIGSGLGGRARWLAARTGCRVVGIDPRPPVIAAAQMLNRRARMDGQVEFQVGRPDCLPVRGRVFTHVWIVDVPADLGIIPTCVEAFRALRGGAHFAMQCSASSDAARDALLGALGDVGFVDIAVAETVVADLPHACRLARERLAVQADGRSVGWYPSDRAPAARQRLQIFARRPA